VVRSLSLRIIMIAWLMFQYAVIDRGSHT
jgi:hypothetical protein